MAEFWRGADFTLGAIFAICIVSLGVAAFILFCAAVYGSILGARDAARRKRLREDGKQVDTSSQAPPRVIFPPPGARRK